MNTQAKANQLQTSNANLKSGRFWIYLICFATIGVLFYFLFAINSFYFNSDQAVHVLMIQDFKWPADAYYWGQNRLGSILPLLGYIFYSVIKINPIILLFFINYCMLAAGWLIFSKYLKSDWAKLLFCLCLFFPHPTYFYIIQIGHPYQGQFLTIALSTIFLKDLYHKYESLEKWTIKDYLKLLSTIFTSLLAIWVSEFSLIFYVFILFYILFSERFRKSNFSFSAFKSNLLLPIITCVSLLLIGIFVLKDIKNNYQKDPIYDKFFITDLKDIKLQFSYLSDLFFDVLLLRNHHTIFECIFYYSVVIAVIVIILNFKKLDQKTKTILNAFIYTFLISFLLLFFSSWNYRGKYDPKYHTLLYPFLLIFIGIGIGNFSKWKQIILVFIVGFPVVYSNYDYIKNNYDNESMFKKYDAITHLPKGTLVADYWKAYKWGALGFYNITGVSKNDWDCRNLHKIKTWSKNRNFYFLKNEIPEFKYNQDTLVFRNMKFIPMHKQFIVLNDTLLWYNNLDTNKY
jgi:hypothetical protein